MWIEIKRWRIQAVLLIVTPLAGVWIEMGNPSWSRCGRAVTPLAGVWIEMITSYVVSDAVSVTPLAGVWIEIICLTAGTAENSPSLPLRECGLK